LVDVFDEPLPVDVLVDFEPPPMLRFCAPLPNTVVVLVVFGVLLTNQLPEPEFELLFIV
jgi:hypothetical protein